LHGFWVFVTDCGDSALTLPLALLVLVFLMAARERRLALAWLLAAGGCAAAIGGLKLIFGACGRFLPLMPIASPSGHTAMSSVIYGSLALLIGAGLPVRLRIPLYAASGFGVGLIGVSRMVLREHSLAEVSIGWLVGGAACCFFGLMVERVQAQPPVLRLRWLLLLAALAAAVLHGRRWTPEPAIHHLAWHFRLLLPWCR